MAGKLLKRNPLNRIYSYFAENGLIRDSQHSFVHGTSCFTNVIEFLKEIMKVMDFSKAFDKVLHNRLIRRLRCMGLTMTII